MDNKAIHEQISDLVAEEQRLRNQGGPDGRPAPASELRRIGEQLDQCWDLLRQRRAQRDQDETERPAQVRPVSEVEGYRQ